MKIAVAGTGYVGLSIAVLLAQNHQVAAVDILPEKVELINARKSPIQDAYIEKYLAEKELNLVATLDAEAAYRDADYVVIDLIGNRHKVSVGHVDCLFANDEMDSECLAVVSVFDGHCTKNQEDCSSDDKDSGEDCYSHDSFHCYIQM